MSSMHLCHRSALKSAATVLLSVLLALPAHAAYVVIGQVDGNVCKGFIIESCRMYPIAGVKAKDGQVFTLKAMYENVDEFNESSGRCWIKTKSKGAGWVSLGINAIAQPTFVTKAKDGSYTELDVEYLTFKCTTK